MDVTVASDYIVVLGVPHNELFIWYLHRVELVNVYLLACATTCRTECYFAQTSNLAHHIGCFCRSDYVNLVVTPVCETQ